MAPLHFGTLRFLFTWQLLWLLAPAVPIPEITGNPVQLTSEPWMPTKLWYWHPSDHPPKATHTRRSKTDTGAIDHLGCSVSTEMYSPLEELTDSLLPFQDPSTFWELNPESEELVPHKDMTDKLIPTGKQPGNILTIRRDQNQALTLPEFKSTASLVGAADYQLNEILVIPLDSQTSKATTFIVSTKELKKDLAQHKKLAKVVVGKLKVQNKIMDDYYDDLTINEPHSYSIPLQSQDNADEVPELLEQVELDLMEKQTRNPEKTHQETLYNFPQSPEEDEPLVQKKDPAQILKSTKKVVTQTLDYKEGVLLAPVKGQAASAIPPSMSLQPLDQALTTPSQASAWSHHPPNPKETKTYPTPPIFLHYAEPPMGPVVEPPDLFFLKITKSKPVQENPTQITKSPEDIVAQSLEFKKDVLPDSFEGQAESAIPPSMSLQPLDQALTTPSQASAWSHHPPNPKETKTYPTPPIFLHYAEPPMGPVVEPPDLFFLKITKSKPVQENPTQITKSPEDIVAQSLEFKKDVLPDSFEGQAESAIPPSMSLQPLDQALTTPAQASAWSHHPPNPKETKTYPTPPIFLHYAEPPMGPVVEPPDLFFLKITKSKPVQENPTQITKTPEDIVAQCLEFKKDVLPDSFEGQAESAIPPSMSLQPLDQALTTPAQASAWSHHPPNPKETKTYPTPPIFLHYAEPPMGPVVEPPDLFVLKTTKSKPVQENPTQITKSPEDIVAQSLEFKEDILPDSVEGQPETLNPPVMSL
ncbi:uncharacterized protein LOC143442647 [Arvicanthis niloticus]|uniref:uncharacterized protein LOC143312877 n=1 Tax=Arvicanthis niloticus TaxID=61156 RepID=UPI00402B99DD